MKEEKRCPVCGMKMKMLSPQSWMCKCGYVEKGETSKRARPTSETEREKDEEESRVRFWEDKKGKIRKETSVHREKRVGRKKKRTSTRG